MLKKKFTILLKTNNKNYNFVYKLARKNVVNSHALKIKIINIILKIN